MKGFRFILPLTIRVADLNYANHVGYQNYLAYFQEARLAYLDNLGYSELDIDGYGIMIAEVTCRYRQELFLKDSVQVGCRVAALRSKSFRMDYEIRREGSLCAEGHTDCLCVDPHLKKVARLPDRFTAAVKQLEGI